MFVNYTIPYLARSVYVGVRMRRFIFLTVIFISFGIGTLGFAQSNAKQSKSSKRSVSEKREHRIERNLKRLTKKLNLSTDQTEKIREELQKGQAKRIALRHARKKDKQRKKGARKALREETHRSILKHLQPTQVKQFEKLKAKRKKNHKAKFRLKKMNKVLALTPEQKKKARVIFKAKRMESKALRNSEFPKQEIRMKRKALRKAAMADFRKLLTPEQKKKFREFRKKNKNKKGKKK